MELKGYIAPLLKWWWLPIVAALMAGGAAYPATDQLPSVYQAHTTLIIGQSFESPTITNVDFGVSSQVAQAYADIALREPVRNATMKALGLEELPNYETVANRQLLEISVTDNIPQRAQAVANELAIQLIRLSPTSSGDPERQEFINQELDGLEASIKATKEEVNRLQSTLGQITSASELANTQQQIVTLESKLNLLQSNYATLLANTEKGSPSTIRVLEPAALPVEPIGLDKKIIVLLAAACGFVLATAAAYLLEYLDDTFEKPEDIARLIQSPIVGYIADMGKGNQERPYVAEQPRSMIAEAFRSLRTNLEFTSEKALKTIFVTSSSASEGKTSVAVNLAIAMAQGGKRVVLLDADLRRPGVHRFLGMSNHDGLSNVFQGQLDIYDAVQTWQDEKLAVITAGTRAAVEIPGHKKLDKILSSLEEMADVVIVDGPPFFAADAWVLGARADGVLLVIRPGHTRKGAIKAMMEQVNRSGAKLIGVTLNRIPRKQADLYSGALYISPYYASSRYEESGAEDGATARGSKKSLQSLLKGLQKEPSKINANGNGRAKLPAPPTLEVLPAKTGDVPATERDRATLDLLYAISRELATHLDSRDLLQRILKLTLESVGASSGSIVVLDEKGEVLDGVLAYDGKVHLQDAQQFADTVERGLAGWVVEHRQAALISSTRDDPRWLQRSWDDDHDGASRSAISVPLVAGDRVVGVLTVVQPEAGQFAEKDLSMLTAIAVCVSFNSGRVLPAGS